jgi:hypothetical protein
MGVTIRPDSWILKVFDNKKERNLRVADYLDEIATEATKIAEIWDKILTSLSSEGSLDSESIAILDKLIRKPERQPYMNCMPFSKLEMFYQSASTVFGKAKTGDLEYVIFKISSILQTRKLTVKKVEEELKRIKNAKYFDGSNENKNISQIAESIDLMYKEAAALDVYTKEFRAKI